jgi:hypothetical protein
MEQGKKGVNFKLEVDNEFSTALIQIALPRLQILIIVAVGEKSTWMMQTEDGIRPCFTRYFNVCTIFEVKLRTKNTMYFLITESLP